MTPRAAVAFLVLLLLGLPAVDVLAQDLGAEVRTWQGQSVRLSQASFEILYTIVPRQQTAGPGGIAAGGAGGGGVPSYGGASLIGDGGGSFGGTSILGGMSDLQSFARWGRQYEPIYGRRPVDYLNVYQNGVTHRLAVARIESIVFKRESVPSIGLPPWVEHFRSMASVTFTDGSTLAADYVNPGTMLLRGVTPEGRVEIPWQYIETVHLTR